jgi:hypothetical protein
MARIRTIKPEFFRHEELFAAESETGLPLRVAFAGLWTVADKEGRFRWKPRQLKLDCLPFDNVDFARVLDALATRGFIVHYASESGEEYGCMPTWNCHQVINNRESESILPSMEDCLIKSTTSTREPRVSHATVTPLMHAQGEGKGKGREGKGKGKGIGALVEKPESVSESVWDDFCKHREARRAIVTKTALDGIRREADKAGWSLEEALAECCARGWVGFKASFVSKRETRGGDESRKQPVSFAEQDRRNGIARWEAQTGRIHPERHADMPLPDFAQQGAINGQKMEVLEAQNAE